MQSLSPALLPPFLPARLTICAWHLFPRLLPTSVDLTVVFLLVSWSALFLFVIPFPPERDKQPISPPANFPRSKSKVLRIKQMISNRKKLLIVKKYFTTPFVPRNEETHEQFMRFLIHNEFLKDWLYELLLVPGVEIEERKTWTGPFIFASQLFHKRLLMI